MKILLSFKARSIIGGLIGLLFAFIVWSGAMKALEDLTVDIRLRLRDPQPVSDDVRLVGTVTAMLNHSLAAGLFRVLCMAMF